MAFPEQMADEDKVVFCFDFPAEISLDMLMAAHFLDIPDLLEYMCKMVADHIDGTLLMPRLFRLSLTVEDTPSLEGLAPEVVNLIYHHLSPQKLFEVETSRKFPDPSHGSLALLVICNANRF